jgi:hypothetical protein
VITEVTLNAAPVAAALDNGGWLVLAGTLLERITANERETVTTVSPPAERTASLTTDAPGNAYIYLGDAQSTLLAVGAGGDLLWRATYPTPAGLLPPLLASGSGCVLYALDVDGRLHAFNTQDGALVNQLQLYAGGTRNGSPGARLLRMDNRDLVMAASGFLTMVALDGRQLGAAACG